MTHWKKLTNPDYLGAYSLENGQEIVLTIKSVRNEMVTGNGGKKEECTVCHFVENVKPMILNASNINIISKIYSTPYIEEWSGKKIQIGSERVNAFGEITEALRIRNVIPQEQKEIKCECCGSPIQPVGKMNAEQTATYTRNKYGQTLCSACATKKAQEVKNNVE